MKLPQSIIEMIKTIEDSGYECYVVGGYVRDYLLNIETFDIDLSTNAHPSIIEQLFTKQIKQVSPYGSIMLNDDVYQIEITTFRKEGIYHNQRHPSKVEFIDSVIDDLKRRDFTINAIAYRYITHQWIDPYQGKEAIKQKRLISIDDPNTKFDEDGLRILRGLRIASTRSLDIDGETYQAMINHKTILTHLSKERIHQEWTRYISGQRFHLFKEDIQIWDVLIQQTKPLNEIRPIKEDVHLRTIYLLMSVSNQLQKIEESLVHLGFNHKEIRYMKHIYQLSLHPLPINRIDLKKILQDFSIDYYQDYICLLNENQKHIQQGLLDEIILRSDCFNLNQLNINGQHLKALNIKDKQIGDYLNHILQLVIQEELENNEEQIILYLLNKIF